MLTLLRSEPEGVLTQIVGVLKFRFDADFHDSLLRELLLVAQSHEQEPCQPQSSPAEAEILSLPFRDPADMPAGSTLIGRGPA